MPRKGKSDPVEVVHFAGILSITYVGGLSTVQLSPNSTLSARAASIADNYALYRVTALRFRIRHTDSTMSANQLVTFIPGITDTSVASVAPASETGRYSYLSINESVPAPWCIVPRAELMGMHPWYKTVPGTVESAEEIVGNLFCVGTGVENCKLEVAGTFEFKDPVAASETPVIAKLSMAIREERRRLALDAERRRLLSALTPAPVPLTALPK